MWRLVGTLNCVRYVCLRDVKPVIFPRAIAQFFYLLQWWVGRLSEPRNCYPSFTVIFISTKRSPLWAVAHKYIKWSFMTLNSGSLKFSPLWNLYRAVKLYLAVTTPKYGFYCKCFKNKCHWHVKTLIYSILKIKGWPSFRLDTVLTCTFQNLGELFENEDISDWKEKGRFYRRYFACS